MAAGTSKKVNLVSYGSFYEQKSIMSSYKFDVWFNFDKFANNNKTEIGAIGLRHTRQIKPYHILSVDIPFPTLQRGDGFNMGTIQYTYSVLAKEQPLDIRISMEEDYKGNVAKFIQEMYGTVIRNGYHIPPAKSRLGDIRIALRDQQDTTRATYIAKDVFFLGASQISSSYDSNDSVKYDLTFGTDYMTHDDKLLGFNVSEKRLTIKPSNIFG